MEKKSLFVVNPNSRSGKDKVIHACADKLREGGLNIEMCVRDSPDEVKRYVKQRAVYIDRVIVAGGDGTLHNIADVLYDTGLPLAILPMGTANDLARSLDIPLDPLEACETILDGVLTDIDLGSVNDKVFFNTAHMGLGVKVTDELSPELKKTVGKLSYLHAFYKVMDRMKSFTVSVEIDGLRHKFRAVHVAVGNGRYYGGGNVIDQTCFINDGKLSLSILKKQNLWSLITSTPFLRTGTQKVVKQIHTSRAKSVEVITRSPMEIHADGEPIAHTPATFTVIPSALKVICPEAFCEKRQSDQPVVRIMEWLRDNQNACSEELLVAAQESADYIRDAADSVEDSDLKSRLLHFEKMRLIMVTRFEHYLASKNELPDMPDPDSEWGGMLLNHIALIFSSDHDKAVIEQRIADELKLAELIEKTEGKNKEDLDDKLIGLIQEFKDNNSTLLKGLRSLLSESEKRSAGEK